MKGNYPIMYSKSNMNIVFMGTPDFAVPSLQALLNHEYQVSAVVTQPDKPQGRKKVLLPTPVKSKAMEAELSVLQPVKIKSAEAIEQLKSLKPDLIVTAAYGQILPIEILSIPRLGCINVHASLLPKYRGGAPIHHAIIRGERYTGVTIMYMEEGLDTGDMISQSQLEITRNDTVGSVFDKLAQQGAELLVKTLPKLMDQTVQAQPQEHSQASYAPNIKKQDEMIEWSQTSEQIYDHVRGLNPSPVAYTLWNDQRLKVWMCLDPKQEGNRPIHQGSPGTVLNSTEKGIEVKTGDGSIWIHELQPSGKKRMQAEQFHRGTQIAEGTKLGGNNE